MKTINDSVFYENRHCHLVIHNHDIQCGRVFQWRACLGGGIMMTINDSVFHENRHCHLVIHNQDLQWCGRVYQWRACRGGGDYDDNQ